MGRRAKKQPLLDLPEEDEDWSDQGDDASEWTTEEELSEVIDEDEHSQDAEAGQDEEADAGEEEQAAPNAPAADAAPGTAGLQVQQQESIQHACLCAQGSQSHAFSSDGEDEQSSEDGSWEASSTHTSSMHPSSSGRAEDTAASEDDDQEDDSDAEQEDPASSFFNPFSLLTTSDEGTDSEDPEAADSWSDEADEEGEGGSEEGVSITDPEEQERQLLMLLLGEDPDHVATLTPSYPQASSAPAQPVSYLHALLGQQPSSSTIPAAPPTPTVQVPPRVSLNDVYAQLAALSAAGVTGSELIARVAAAYAGADARRSWIVHRTTPEPYRFPLAHQLAQLAYADVSFVESRVPGASEALHSAMRRRAAAFMAAADAVPPSQVSASPSALEAHAASVRGALAMAAAAAQIHDTLWPHPPAAGSAAAVPMWSAVAAAATTAARAWSWNSGSTGAAASDGNHAAAQHPSQPSSAAADAWQWPPPTAQRQHSPNADNQSPSTEAEAASQELAHSPTPGAWQWPPPHQPHPLASGPDDDGAGAEGSGSSDEEEGSSSGSIGSSGGSSGSDSGSSGSEYDSVDGGSSHEEEEDEISQAQGSTHAAQINATEAEGSGAAGQVQAAVQAAVQGAGGCGNCEESGDEDEDGCWICLGTSTPASFGGRAEDMELMAPCGLCRGGVGAVHKGCFRKWLSSSWSLACANCARPYTIDVLQSVPEGRTVLGALPVSGDPSSWRNMYPHGTEVEITLSSGSRLITPADGFTMPELMRGIRGLVDDLAVQHGGVAGDLSVVRMEVQQARYRDFYTAFGYGRGAWEGDQFSDDYDSAEEEEEDGEDEEEEGGEEWREGGGARRGPSAPGMRQPSFSAQRRFRAHSAAPGSGAGAGSAATAAATAGGGSATAATAGHHHTLGVGVPYGAAMGAMGAIPMGAVARDPFLLRAMHGLLDHGAIGLTLAEQMMSLDLDLNMTDDFSAPQWHPSYQLRLARDHEAATAPPMFVQRTYDNAGFAAHSEAEYARLRAAQLEEQEAQAGRLAAAQAAGHVQQGVRRQQVERAREVRRLQEHSRRQQQAAQRQANRSANRHVQNRAGGRRRC